MFRSKLTPLVLIGFLTVLPALGTANPSFLRAEDTEAGITVEAYVVQMPDGTVKTEFISQPPGRVRLIRTKLTSPEGVIYAPKDIYEISEQAARNLGRLRPTAVAKQSPKKSTKSKIGSALVGTAIGAALSGWGGSPQKAVSSSAYNEAGHTYQAASGSSTALKTMGAVGGGLAASAIGQSGKSDSGETDQWLEPVTAGTGIFSSVAEFEIPERMDPSAPWTLGVLFDQMNGWVKTYCFTLPPVVLAGPGPQYSPKDIKKMEGELEDLKKKEKKLEEEYQEAVEEFEKAKEKLEERGGGGEIRTEAEVGTAGKGKKKKKFEPKDELEKDFLDKLEAAKKKEAELQKAALEREAAEKKLKETRAQKPVVPPPVVGVKPPAAGGGAVPVAQAPAPAPLQGPCGFFEKKLLRTVESEWRPKRGNDFALPGRDPAIIVIWEKDIGNEFQVTGHCPLPLGHAGDHTPVEIVYEKVRTITQEESYPPGTRHPKPPKDLGLPKRK